MSSMRANIVSDPGVEIIDNNTVISNPFMFKVLLNLHEFDGYYTSLGFRYGNSGGCGLAIHRIISTCAQQVLQMHGLINRLLRIYCSVSNRPSARISTAFSMPALRILSANDITHLLRS